jgi:hypothetical protein
MLEQGQTRKISEKELDKFPVCRLFYSTYTQNNLTEDALEGFGDFAIRGQVIRTLKYADYFVLLVAEEKVLQGKVDKLIEIGRCYGMEINMEKLTNEHLKETVFIEIYGRSEQTGECEIFQLFA